MKKYNYLYMAISFFTAVLLAFFIINTVGSIKIDNASKLMSLMSISVDAFLLCYICAIYKNKYVIFLGLTFASLFINDIIFYLIAYSKIVSVNDYNNIFIVLDVVSHMLWVIFLLIFLLNILVRHMIYENKKLKIIISLSLLYIVLIILYHPAFQYSFSSLPSWSILHKLSFISELLLLGIVVLCLIYSENKGLSLLATGFVLLIAADSLITYSYMANLKLMDVFGEFFWLLGLLTILLGVILFQKSHILESKSLLARANAIRTKLSLWSVKMSASFVLIFYIVCYFMLHENREILVILPPFLVLTVAFMIILSMYTGMAFEKPFKKITENIKELMLGVNKNKIDNHFEIDEFIFLQKFIIESYEIKEERDYTKKALGEFSTQVAHDIRSPVAAILMLTRESMNLPEELRVIIRDAANRIQDITNNMLDKVRETGTNSKTIDQMRFLVSTAVISVIIEKRIEYSKYQVNIEYECDPSAMFCVIQANSVEFKRVLSNLLNNAVEAIEVEGAVRLRLYCVDNSVQIDIIDTGQGMSSSMINNIMKGESISSKISGLGLGLSHAHTFMQTCNGQLKIVSEESLGTTVSLVFNKLMDTNYWVAQKVKIDVGSTIVILDDDKFIHEAWDNLFNSFFKRERIDLHIVHFTDALMCLAFIKQLEPTQVNGIMLLADYELIKQDHNGLDVIEQAQIHQAVLVTSYDENKDIIKRAMLLNTQILPKLLIAEVKLELVEPASMKAAGADLVVVEDNKAFSEVISYLYEYRGKSLDTYHEPYALFENLYRYDKLKTKFCLDFDLGGMINGIELAGALHKRGFKQLYLASGYQFEAAKIPSYLQVLTNKMELLNL